MPYLQANWIQLLRASKGDSPASEPQGHNPSAGGNKVLRTVPHDKANKGAHKGGGVVSDEQEQPSKMDVTRMQCICNIVKSQIEEMRSSVPPLTTDDEAFYRYTITVEMVVFSGLFSNIYLAHHQDQPEYPLIGRIFEPSAKIDPRRSMYIKILKHLGKRHHSLIGIWDIFFDGNGRVVIFQEFALHGNMQEYIKTNNVFVPEAQMVEWAKQIYRGMDFLGDAGICHRAINPKHIMLTPNHEDSDKTLAKLGSFRDAVVYYDPKERCIRNQRCRPLDKRSGSPYHAPEVFGDPLTEEFDPLTADIWSFGATFFVASARVYPCRYKSCPDDISQGIQKTINNAHNLSIEAKHWFSGLLRGDATHRTTFDKIEADPWYKAFN